MLVYLADSELVLKFSAGLAVSVNLVATVDNVQHIDRLRIQVHITLSILGFLCSSLTYLVYQ